MLKSLGIFLFSFLILFPQKSFATVGESVRLRELGNCGFYLASIVDGRVDDTYGEKIVEYRPEDLEKSLEDFEAFLSAKPNITGTIVLAGTSIYGKDRWTMSSRVKALLKKHGYSHIKLRLFKKPSGYGLRRILEELTFLLPLNQHFQKPVLSEWVGGLASMFASEASLLTVLLTVGYFESHSILKAALIAAPIVIVSVFTNSVFGVLRRSVSNYVNISTGRPVEKYLKEAMITTLFSSFYYNAARFSEYKELVKEHGLSYFWENFGVLSNAFFSSQLPTIVMHTLFFTNTFAGIYYWDQMITRDATDKELATRLSRRTQPILIGAIFVVSTPLLALANKLHSDVFAGLNVAQLGLGGLAVAGSFVWWKPELITPVALFLDKHMKNSVMAGKSLTFNEPKP